MEQPVHFLSENLELEAMIDRQDEKNGVVITHPHPLHGGDMHNHVVDVLRQAYAQNGFTTLRFNFRGAGRSQGLYDEGRGEQSDVRAAVTFLKEKGVREVDLAGYSFGAWVNALAVTGGLQTERLVMVSPPVAFVGFDGVGELPNLQLVVTGSRDDFAPADQIQPQLPQWNPATAMEIIEGCDHFYSGHGRELEEIITRHLADR